MSVVFKDRQKNASLNQITSLQRILMAWLDHFRQIFASLGELYRTPFASFLTISVLGISLTLPGVLYIIVNNTEKVTEDWQQAAEISLFLKQDLEEAKAQQLVTRLSLWSEIAEVNYISAQQALDEFQLLSGLGDAITYLEDNPLPAVVTVVPTSKHVTPQAAQILLQKLIEESEVDSGVIDIEWLERLNAVLEFAKSIVLMLTALLLLAVVLIIGNTIRLNILNKKDEIIVMKLVGATDAFIHRPFLYRGFWYGFLGGVIAWICISVVLFWIDLNIQNMFEKYRISIDVTGLDLSALIIMMLISVSLGLLGSFLSVRRHVRSIEPE